MKVKVSLHDIPLPGDQTEASYKQARVQSDGTIRLNEICCELRELGVNSAQIKSVLDAVAKYINITKYAVLNDCSRHQARKEMEEFVKEGILLSSGLRTHKIYELA